LIYPVESLEFSNAWKKKSDAGGAVRGFNGAQHSQLSFHRVPVGAVRFGEGVRGQFVPADRYVRSNQAKVRGKTAKHLHMSYMRIDVFTLVMNDIPNFVVGLNPDIEF
jgi:hypothetical protein